MFLQAIAPNAHNILASVLLLILSYFIGSIPFGLLIGKGITGVDIRQYGSGNIGSTNAVRVLGKKVGYLVFLCDCLKGAIVVIVLKIIAACGGYVPCIDYGWFGLAAVVGHSYSIFLNFKGGKAVATSLGAAICVCPLAGILGFVIFGICLFVTGYVSVSSTVGSAGCAIIAWILFFIGYPVTNFGTAFIGTPGAVNAAIITLIFLVIVIKHIPNYKRLLAGTENSFKKKKIQA